MRAPTLIGLLVMLAALAAHADDGKDQAKRDVGAALAAQDAGRYDEAIALYKRAYEAVPHPEILFNLGQAYRLKGDAETALGYYRRYLAAEPDGRAAKDAQRWVTELGKRVADKREPARKADDAHKADTGRAAASAPKTRAETGRAATAPKTRAERAAATVPKAGAGKPPEPRPPDVTQPDADPVPSAAPGPTGPSSVDAGAANGTVPAAPRSSDDSRRSPYVLSAWITGLGGGASLIGGLAFGALAQSKLDQATAICGTDHRCDTESDTKRANALLSQSRSHGTISTVLVVIGVTGLVTSGVLWLGSREGSRQAVIAPIASPELVGLAVGGAF